MSYNCSVEVLKLHDFTVPRDIPEKLVTELLVSFETYPLETTESVVVYTAAEEGYFSGEIIEDRIHVDDIVCYGESSGYMWNDLFMGYLFKRCTGYAKFLVTWENGDRVEIVEAHDGTIYRTPVSVAVAGFSAIGKES